MNNGDLISRSALLEMLPKDDVILSFDVRKVVCDAPAVDAEVVRHGRWTRLGPNWHECSVCKARTSIFSGTKCYCPNCGAKMDGKVQDGTKQY